ncbi:extracellular solute-binding protein [Candidatus Bipolaricaulota bacterium]|nr:extracellular solute-binding protein [Candidatus Bipolaricaulota bacterium]
MKLRSLIVVTLIAAFAMGFVAMAQEPVTVEFWHRFSERHHVTLEQLSSWFEALYPHITIEWVYQGSYSALQQKITGSVVAGEVPTMTIFYEDWIPPVADALLPLGPYFTDEEIADIVPGLLYKDMLTVPFNKSIMVLYYIEEYVPVPPANWQEFYDMAVANTVDEDGDGTIDRYGAGFRPAANPEQFLALLEQNNGSILNADMTEVTLGNAAGLEAANFYASLAPYSWVTSEYLNSNVGYAAMAIDTSAGYYYWNTAAEGAGLTVKTAVLPAGKKSASFIQGTNIGIFKDSPRAEIDAGILFLKFLLEGENTGFWAARTGYLPVTQSGLDSAVWTLHQLNSPEVAPSSEMMPLSVGSLAHPNYGDIRSVLSTMCEEIMLGAATVEEAVATAVAEIEALLDY